MTVRSMSLSFVAAAALAIAIFGTRAQARPGQSKTPRYDSRTETTISGVVQEVREVPGPGRSTGRHLIVKTNEALVEVHLGPTWYLKEHKWVIAKGDQAEVTGSKVKFQEKEIVLARELKKGGDAWALRDAQGIPMWSRAKQSQ